MSTLVCFHAHPDDECLITGGTIKKASQDGHRVVLVVATGGEQGEYPEGFLNDRSELKAVRHKELLESAAVLGISKIYFLGYEDSGMMGTASNENELSFFRANVDAAAKKLAAILSDEMADTLTIYDEIGGYGHPDHIMVYRVGKLAAEIAGIADVLQATMNRDKVTEIMNREKNQDPSSMSLEDQQTLDAENFGMPATLINMAVDVSDVVMVKRSALAKHESQVQSSAFVFNLSDQLFVEVFGTEWFIAKGERGKITRHSIF